MIQSTNHAQKRTRARAGEPISGGCQPASITVRNKLKGNGARETVGTAIFRDCSPAFVTGPGRLTRNLDRLGPTSIRRCATGPDLLPTGLAPHSRFSSPAVTRGELAMHIAARPVFHSIFNARQHVRQDLADVAHFIPSLHRRGRPFEDQPSERHVVNVQQVVGEIRIV